jgi:hypothetical protein
VAALSQRARRTALARWPPFGGAVRNTTGVGGWRRESVTATDHTAKTELSFQLIL